MGKALSPLNWQVPIVHPSGTPTSEFQRAWAQLQDASSAIQPIQTTQEMSDLLDLIGATPGSLLHRGPSGWQIITGANGDLLKRGAAGWQVLPSPNDNTKFLAGDLTWQSAGGGNIQTMLDTISTTQGVVLYRGASAWAALAPGTAGDVLATGGAGADPSWVPQSGSGGSLPTWAVSASGLSAASVSSNTTASKGSVLYLCAPVTVHKLGITLGAPTNGAQYVGRILTITNAGSPVATAVTATTSTVTWATGQSRFIALPFASPVTLAADVIYAVIISWANAASGSTALPAYTGSQYRPCFYPMPILDVNDNNYGSLSAAVLAPTIGTVFTKSASNNYYVSAEWSP